jgi:hypothetical protein
MLLLYGRRRLGKTFLLQRYFTAGVDGDEHEKPHSYFLAEQSTAATQRLTLARQLIAALASKASPPRILLFRGMLFFAMLRNRQRGAKKAQAGLLLSSMNSRTW